MAVSPVAAYMVSYTLPPSSGGSKIVDFLHLSEPAAGDCGGNGVVDQFRVTIVPVYGQVTATRIYLKSVKIAYYVYPNASATEGQFRAYTADGGFTFYRSFPHYVHFGPGDTSRTLTINKWVNFSRSNLLLFEQDSFRGQDLSLFCKVVDTVAFQPK